MFRSFTGSIDCLLGIQIHKHGNFTAATWSVFQNLVTIIQVVLDDLTIVGWLQSNKCYCHLLNS